MTATSSPPSREVQAECFRTLRHAWKYLAMVRGLVHPAIRQSVPCRRSNRPRFRQLSCPSGWCLERRADQRVLLLAPATRRVSGSTTQASALPGLSSHRHWRFSDAYVLAHPESLIEGVADQLDPIGFATAALQLMRKSAGSRGTGSPLVAGTRNGEFRPFWLP